MENTNSCDNQSLTGGSSAAAMFEEHLPLLGRAAATRETFAEPDDFRIRRSASYSGLPRGILGPRSCLQKAVSHESIDTIGAVDARNWFNVRPASEGFATPWASPTRDMATSFNVSQLAAQLENVSLGRSLAWRDATENGVEVFSKLPQHLPGTELASKGDINCDVDCSEMDYTMTEEDANH